MKHRISLALFLCLTALTACDPAKTGTPEIDTSVIHLSCTQDDLTYAYTRYVEPFVSVAVSTSGSECHLTGIDITLDAE